MKPRLPIAAVLLAVAMTFALPSAATAAERGHVLPAGQVGRAIALLAIYSTLIVTASLSGGWLPSLVKLTHTRMQMIVSLVAGLMLGVGLFHMLPNAVRSLGSDAAAVDRTVQWLVGGLVGMFFLVRAFHFHQHEAPHEHGREHGTLEPMLFPIDTGQVYDQPLDCGPHSVSPGGSHDHDHDDVHPREPAPSSSVAVAHPPVHGDHDHGHHRLSWVGVALGLAVHTFIDGMALAASVRAEAGHGTWLSLFGLGTFLAIVLHKPLDAMSITSLMAAAGWSRAWRNAVNTGFALMCPLGAALLMLGVDGLAGAGQTVVGCALAFSAGVFLCIALGDLLPELEFHSHDRIKLSMALLAGLAIAYGLLFMESGHSHG